MSNDQREVVSMASCFGLALVVWGLAAHAFMSLGLEWWVALIASLGGGLVALGVSVVSLDLGLV